MRKFRMFVASLLMLSLLALPLSLNLTSARAADGTGEVVLTGGSLTISIPASISYSAVTIDGLVAKNSTASFNFSVTDATGSGTGWKVTMYSTVMTSGGHTITAPNHTFKATGSVALASTDTGTAATNSITAPTGAIPTTALSSASLYNAAVDSGMGTSTITVNTNLNVPIATYAGTYDATITLSVVSGPS